MREIRLPRVQIDPGSAVHIMPLRALAFLGIPINQLSRSSTTIEAYNAQSQETLGKIKVPLQLGSLKAYVICYVIDAETSYNLLLERPWIHENFVVPFTLHQYFKYVDDDGKVCRVFADERPFKGCEAYCTDARLY